MKDFKYVKQTPHCDAKVLHKQGSCQYCDMHPEWQELRQIWGIAFTGHSEDTVKAYDHATGVPYDRALIPCPSEWDRPVETIHDWHGNRPSMPGKPLPPEDLPWSKKPKATLSGKPVPPGAEEGAPGPIDPATGQHTDYYVLPQEERRKGFLRPYRDSYRHKACGTVTSMGRDLSETYARDPKYYGATFCCGCRTHFPVSEFTWTADGKVVGS